MRSAVSGVVFGILIAEAACSVDPGYAGRSSGEWVAQLSDTSTDRRVDAAIALGRVLALQPDEPAAVTALVRALADTSDEVRTTAARALTEAAHGDKRTRTRLSAAVPGLASLMTDSAHPAVRTEAATVLGTVLGALAQARDENLSPAGTQAGARALAAAFGDSVPAVRLAALGAVAAFGPGVRAEWPGCDTALVRLAGQDPSASARRAALDALARTRAPGALVQAALVRGTSDADPDVRVAAVTTLGLLADTAGQGVRAALWRALADADAGVRREALHALTALHRRGGQDSAPPEPSAIERCTAGGNARPDC